VAITAVALTILSLAPASLASGTDPSAERVASSTSVGGGTDQTSSGTTAPEPQTPSVDPQVDGEIAASGSTRVIVTLRSVTRSNDDGERRTANATEFEQFRAELPVGSFAEVTGPGTLPIATMQVDAAGLQAIRGSKRVAAVEADTLLQTASLASSSVVGTQRAVAAGWSGAGETVAILDTGVATAHPYLMDGTRPKTIAEACFSTTSSVSRSSCPGGAPMRVTDAPRAGWGQPCDLAVSSACAHGTAVAGAAVGGTGVGTTTGAAPGASLISVKVFGYDATDPTRIGAAMSDVNLGLDWLYLHRMEFPDLAAVNLSLGGGRAVTDCRSSSVQAHIHQLADVGIATVVAAGNDGFDDAVTMPACAPDAIAVSAIDDAHAARAGFGNLSPKVALFAPGVGITTARAAGGAVSVSGTSLAAPIVTGSWAVLRQRFPSMSVAEALDHLRTTGIGITTDTAVTRYVIPLIRVDLAMRPPASAASLPPTNLTTVTPARLMDTRPEPTIDSLDHDTGAFGPGESRRFRVTGRGYVPSNDVASISLNVTVAAPTTPGFLTVYGSDQPRPEASNLNFTPGILTSNMVVVRVAADGTITIFNSAGSTQVIVDVLGWFPAAGDLQSVTPARLMDTRDAPTIDGRFRDTGAFGPAESRVIAVTGRGGVPSSGVGAVALNLTVAGSTMPGYLTVHPPGTPRPTASSINFGPSQIVPNMVIVPVDLAGGIRIFNFMGRTDIVVDVLGWFPHSATFTPLTPARLLDTRDLPTIDGRFSGTGALGGGARLDLQVTGRGGVPDTTVAAVAVNLTVDRPSLDGFITAYPSGIALPGTSTINFTAGMTRANTTIVPVGSDGRISLFNLQGSTHVIVDVLAWFR
jgi:hypothetical protein